MQRKIVGKNNAEGKVVADTNKISRLYPNVSSPIDFDKFKEFSFDAYSQIGLNHLLIYTVYTLQKDKQPVTFENIVVAAHKMFPAKFSLVSYPQYPDAARVQLVILHLGPKYVGWLTGKKKTAYHLNPRGLQAVDEVNALLKGAVDKDMKLPGQNNLGISQDNIANRTAVETRFNHIKDSKSYQIYKEGRYADIEDVSLVWDAFQLFISVDDSTKAETYQNLIDTVKRVGDSEILQFLTWIAKNRTYLIGKSKGRKHK